MKTLFSLALLATAVQAQTLTLSEATTVQASPNRIGINFAATNYYDSGQMYKNLVGFNNPGFEGFVKSQIIYCANGTTTTCVADDIYDGAPTNFWAGATFQFKVGATGITSCGGTLSGNNTNASNTQPITYTFSSACSQAPVAGDYMEIRQTSTLIQGWAAGISGGATYGPETTDLSGSTQGTQAAKLDTSAASSSVNLTTYIDSTNDNNYVLFSGNYSFTFWMKRVSGSSTITASVSRGVTGGVSASQGFTPTTSWAQYTLTFTGTETSSTPAGTVSINFGTTGQGVLELDDVQLTKTSGQDAANTTVYRDEAVHLLQSINPGTLRLWDEHVGESLDNWITPQLGRKTSNYGTGNTGDYPTANDRNGGTATRQGLFDFLQLCELLNVAPWIVVPTSFTTAEDQNLIDFISGGTGTTYGSKRAALGHSASFATTLPHIYLSLGNEAWNSDFNGESMSPRGSGAQSYIRYGQLASVAFGAMKGMASYSTSFYTLNLNCHGDIASTASCQDAHDADAYHDAVEIASYIGEQLTTIDTLAHEWQPDLASAWANTNDATNGWHVAYNNWVATTTRPTVKIVTYEFNSNELRYSTPATGANLATHVGALMNGPMQIMAAMERLRVYNDPQNFWDLNQTAGTGTTDSTVLPLFGLFPEIGGSESASISASYIARPAGLGLLIANGAIQGTMYSASFTSGRPTYSVSALNGLPAESNVPSLFAYAFKNGTARSVLLINTDPSSSATLTWAGDVPAGTLTQTRLNNTTGADDNNETVFNHITMATSTVSAGSTYTVPAATVVSLAWTSGGGSSTNPATVSGALTVKGNVVVH